jgi:hypothetical protein
MKEVSFGRLVREVWNNQELSTLAGPQHRLIMKLKSLKYLVKEWIKKRKADEHRLLLSIEEEIVELSLHSRTHDTTLDLGSRIKDLELKRNKLLLGEEERWHQKSRATWIKSGDKNTTYFHHYASFRCNKKHLWEVTDEMNWVHKG